MSKLTPEGRQVILEILRDGLTLEDLANMLAEERKRSTYYRRQSYQNMRRAQRAEQRLIEVTP